MTFNLTEINLEELSVVDSPANEMAKIAIFKMEGEPEMAEDTEVVKMSDEEMKKMGMTPAQMKKMKAALDKGMSKEDAMKECGFKKSDEDTEMTEKLDTLTKKFEAITKALDENGFDVDDEGNITKRKSPEYVEIDGEKVEKSAVPESILKRLEELEKAEEIARLEKMVNKELPNLKGSTNVKARLIKNFADDAEIMEILRAADALFGEQFQEVGKNTADADNADPSEKLTNMAKARAEDKGETFEKAYTEVMKTKEGRKLYDEIRKTV